MRLPLVAATLALLGAPAPAAQDPYAGKTAAELIELCRRRLAEREPELGTTVPYEEFVEKHKRVLDARLSRVLKTWKQEGWAPSPVEQLIGIGRIYRSWGNTREALKQLDAALRKAQDDWRKRQSNVEMAYLYRLMDNETRSSQYLAQAARYMKNVKLDPDTERVVGIAKGKREYLDLLAKRRDNPRDWRAQWAVCYCLTGFKDQQEMPWLVVETLVALEWLRVAFPSSPPVKDGGVSWFILEVAAPARDVETGLEAADRLWQHGKKNERVASGDLVLKVGMLLWEDEDSRQQALRCFRWLQAENPNHAFVASGDADKRIQALERMKGVKRETTPPPSPPWATK